MRIPIYAGVYQLGVIEKGHGYIATRFVHVYFVPLFPIGGVVVQAAPDGRLVETRGGLSGWSILTAYLKSWGFLAAVGAAFAAHSLIRDPHVFGPVALVAAYGAAGWMALVTLSWLFLGKRRANPSSAGIAIAVVVPAVVLVGFAHAANRRHVVSRYSSSLAKTPGPSFTFPTATPPPDPVAIASLERARDLRLRIGKILRATYAMDEKGWSEAPCPKGTLSLATGGGTAGEALHADYRYLTALREALDKASPEPITVSGWLTSDAFIALSKKYRSDAGLQLDAIDAHPYVAVYFMAESAVPKRVGTKWTAGHLAAHAVVFDLKAATPVCTSGLVRADHAPKDQKVTEEAASRTLVTLFHANATMSLSKLAPDLLVDFMH